MLRTTLSAAFAVMGARCLSSSMLTRELRWRWELLRGSGAFWRRNESALFVDFGGGTGKESMMVEVWVEEICTLKLWSLAKAGVTISDR